MNAKRAQVRAVGSVGVLAGCLLAATTASAEITLFKNDSWDVYTAGRANVFFSYAFGDARPAQGAGTDRTPIGGGVDSATDLIPDTLPNGMPDPTKQGKINKMRFRSGFVPNVLTFGVRRKVNETTTLKAQFSLWGTLETANQRKYVPVVTDWREGYLEIDGTWGSVTGGRFGSLFSRGITQIDFMYGHGYGLGFSGGSGLYNPGPAAGLIGFGVLANSFSPGIMYTTPDLSGFSVAAAVFDPVNLPGTWETTRSARPEAEAMYDMASGSFKMHLFVNGAYQKMYLPGKIDNETVQGVGFGGRAEVGPIHVGGGGHSGKGLGLYYALEGSPSDVGRPDVGLELRRVAGYSFFFQYAPGAFDINLAYGRSQAYELPSDKVQPMGVSESLIKAQTGISAGFVYHATENLHLDVDYLNAGFAWYAGEKQTVNYVNTGITMTW
jgi:hypothetical protein